MIIKLLGLLTIFLFKHDVTIVSDTGNTIEMNKQRIQNRESPGLFVTTRGTFKDKPKSNNHYKTITMGQTGKYSKSTTTNPAYHRTKLTAAMRGCLALSLIILQTEPP